MQQAISFMLNNLPFVILVVAILLPTLSRRNFAKKLCNSLFILAVGATGIWEFVHHIYSPMPAVGFNSWYDSKFEPQVAIINLAFAISGIVAAFAPKSFKASVALMQTVYLWGIAINQVQHVMVSGNNNFEFSSLGYIFITNCITPILLWLSLLIVQLSPTHEDYIR